MSEAVSFVRLDFITVKPYLTLKNFVIFAIAPLILVGNAGTVSVALGMFMMMAVMLASYPFAVGEKNGIDLLYPTLSIRRGTVVLGRYLFSIGFDFITGIFACIYLFVASSVMGHEMNIPVTLATVLTLFIFFSMVQAMQLPIYFKLGYAKAKFLSYVPLMALPLAIVVVNQLSGNNLVAVLVDFMEWIVDNPILAAALGLVIWLASLMISFKISLELYKKRDF